MTEGYEDAAAALTDAIRVGSVFVEQSRFLPSGSQARWRVERIVSLPNLPEHVAIRKLEPGGEERLITLQSLAKSGKYTPLKN
ncbi:hypothetical protein [Ferrovibrio sp.]|uniref:hypothetical protein n=1 Tax=Ferrovibrio sp. TaxID=1917215 RepID=UPI00311E383D